MKAYLTIICAAVLTAAVTCVIQLTVPAEDGSWLAFAEDAVCTLLLVAAGSFYLSRVLRKKFCAKALPVAVLCAFVCAAAGLLTVPLTEAMTGADHEVFGVILAAVAANLLSLAAFTASFLLVCHLASGKGRLMLFPFAVTAVIALLFGIADGALDNLWLSGMAPETLQVTTLITCLSALQQAAIVILWSAWLYMNEKMPAAVKQRAAA